ncbi:hypothetical protein Y032_0492g2422 [Ancylostoma ceylanicum]|uniref:Uncharacterized protein n=1 Tax=Ancylostoma ceylanicum TaxID=53326 RepID=A0A016WW61_9BILA|nr:hypothetical protein Y032_0492g2422 [Ancylostoma ceylanicum]
MGLCMLALVVCFCLECHAAADNQSPHAELSVSAFEDTARGLNPCLMRFVVRYSNSNPKLVFCYPNQSLPQYRPELLLLNKERCYCEGSKKENLTFSNARFSKTIRMPS